MYIIGELADKKMADEIVKTLRSKGLTAETHKNTSLDTFAIFILEKESVQMASEIFRVKTGGPRSFEMPVEWNTIRKVKSGYLTKPIIFLCIAIYIGENYFKLNIYDLLMFSKSKELTELKNYELWRIFTPCLLHFGFIHIFFNLMWWKDLSKVIEKSFGPLFLLIFCIVVGSLSNLSQFLISGPGFGGMSGIIFALFGLNWMLGRFDSSYEYKLPKSDTVLMVGWFILCLTGIMSFSIANMAHAVGLSLGMFTGLVLSFKKSHKRLEMIGFASLALVFIYLGKL